MRNRFIAILFASAFGAVLLTSCSEPTSTSGSRLSPTAPALGFIPPLGCYGTDTSSCGVTGNGVVHTEQVQVCKQYPAGTVNPPAVQVQLDVTTTNPPRGGSPTTGLIFTIQPNSCLTIWQNGEDIGPNTEQVSVKELVPTGYTATSQVTTIIRNGPRGPSETFTTTTNAPTSATTVTGSVGGPQIPGMLVVFTNTAIPTGPNCTLTQGYWKNHESAWPAPYSATAPWLSSTKNTGVTWDGLLETPPQGGNSYLILAHQWIAATLNGASGASMSPSVQSTLAAAGAWLSANTAGGSVPYIKNNAQAIAWASTLDQYNNGLLGTSHCN